MSPYTAVVVDPSRLFREGLEKLLCSAEFTILASIKRLSELSVEPALDAPHLIVFGFDRDMDADEQLQSLSRARMGSPHPHVVVLTCSTENDLLLKAAAAGIDAVLSRDISSEVLQRSLELVMLGQQVFPAAAPRSRSDSDSPVLAIGQQDEAVHRRGSLPVPGASQIEIVPPPGPASAGANAFLAKKLGQASIPLSNREEEILGRLIAGAPNKVIARDLGITEGTVKVHVKSLCRKLGALNRTQAAIWGQVSRSLPAGDDAGMTGLVTRNAH